MRGPLVSVGQGIAPAAVLLDKIFGRQSARLRAPIIVWDAQGVGAGLLNDQRHDFRGARVEWIDLADRQRPAGILRLRPGGARPAIVGALVRTLCRLAGVATPDALVDALVAEVERRGRSGLVTVATLVGAAADPLPGVESPEDLRGMAEIEDALAAASEWPVVRGETESRERVDFSSALDARGPATVVWIEARRIHFDQTEHPVVAALVEAALVDAAFRLTPGHRPRPRIVQLWPRGLGRERLPRWILETSDRVDHLVAFWMWPSQAPTPLGAAWCDAARRVLWSGSTEPPPHLDLRRGRLRAVGTPEGVGTPAARLGHAAHLRRESVRRVREPGRPVAKASGLYAQLCRRDHLAAAWARLWSCGSRGPGSDGQSAEAFRETLDVELRQLTAELCARNYRPRPIQCRELRKPPGGVRKIGMACVRDRVVQYALLMLLEPIGERVFSERSFAFRPGRNARQALELARADIGAGATWVVRGDVRECFDRLSHPFLLRQIARWVDSRADRDLFELLSRLLETEISSFGETWRNDLGSPQGSPLSPLLCNFYLHALDERLEAVGIPFLRYADDILAFASGESSAARMRAVVEETLRSRLYLELNPTKTVVMPISKGFDFLGFTLTTWTVEIEHGRLDRVLEKCRAEIARLGEADASLKERAGAIERYNAMVRGFRGYFGVPGSTEISDALAMLDARTEEIGRRLLPADLANDEAWRLRERFSPSTRVSTAWVAGQLGVYPEPPAPPQEPRLPPPKAHTEAPGEGAAANDSVLDLDGRLLVLLPYCSLWLTDGAVVVRKGKVERYRRSLDELRIVVVQAMRVSLSVELIAQLAESDVPVVVAPSVGPPAAVVQPVRSRRATLRIRQALRRDEPDVRAAGIAMLTAKVANQAAVLRYFAKYRRRAAPAIAEALEYAAGRIRESAETLAGLDLGMEKLPAVAMGHEGQAAALYWTAVRRLVPEPFGFPGRRKRGAEDPVNQCLNYVYGMLYAEVWRAVVVAGLDPYFGILHGSERGEGSLVFDLIEELRAPVADRLVFALLGRGFVPTQRASGELDRPTARHLAAAFLKAWKRPQRRGTVSLPPARILEDQCRNLAELLTDGRSYRPFRMRW